MAREWTADEILDLARGYQEVSVLAAAADLELAARLAARFSQGRDAARVSLQATGLDGTTQALDVVPMPASEIPADWYI